MGGVLVLHPWWGLNDDIRLVGERLAEQGYVVRSPDLYDGKIATEIPDAGRMMRAVDRAAAQKKVDAAVDELRAQGSPIAIVGWSMGGSYAWDFVTRRPGEAAALVAYYAVDEIDASLPLPAVLMHVGELDEDLAYMREMETALKGAGKDAGARGSGCPLGPVAPSPLRWTSRRSKGGSRHAVFRTNAA